MSDIIKSLFESSAVVISVITAIAGIISSIVATRISSRKMSIKMGDTKIMVSSSNVKELLSKIIGDNLDETTAKKISKLYVENLKTFIKKLYPKNDFTISIKLINHSGESSGKAYVSSFLTISDNTDIRKNDTEKHLASDSTAFSTILDGQYDYYLVSDLDEIDFAKTEYRNATKNWQKIYRSVIVYPIRKPTGKKLNKEYYLLGFISIDSLKPMKNVKKNKMIIKHLEKISEELYHYLNPYTKQKETEEGEIESMDGDSK